MNTYVNLNLSEIVQRETTRPKILKYYRYNMNAIDFGPFSNGQMS